MLRVASGHVRGPSTTVIGGRVLLMRPAALGSSITSPAVRAAPTTSRRFVVAAAAAAAAAPTSSQAASSSSSAAAAAGSPNDEASTATVTEGTSAVPPITTPFKYGSRLNYMAIARAYHLSDFLQADFDQTEVLSQTYERADGVRVTIIPIAHLAHPQFYADVDTLCAFHESVLMEGRYSPGNGRDGQIATVPPRPPIGEVRPPDERDAEGWEPMNDDAFLQPYSWGVQGSKKNTIIHAADRYDYERLPWWAGVRFQIPLFGSLSREKHCLNLIPTLVANGYKSFAIPWGAAHAPYFATMLERNNFDLVAQQRLVVFNAVDGPMSAAWTKQIRIHMRILWFFRFLRELTPFGMTVYVIWCLFDGETPFTYVPSPKKFIPLYWYG